MLEKCYSIQNLQPVNDSDKGRRIWEVLADSYLFAQVTIMSRRKGELFGGHFHKGGDPSKNSEVIVFLSGRVRIKFTTKEGETYLETVDATKGPVEVVIEPWVLHELEAKENVWYIEPRPTRFNSDQPDTFPASEFV